MNSTFDESPLLEDATRHESVGTYQALTIHHKAYRIILGEKDRRALVFYDMHLLCIHLGNRFETIGTFAKKHQQQHLEQQSHRGQ
ncbi:hypothetical protein BMS3Bbin04_00068 [bacterium BMS3Bbin04]|nr:hypothetical protein BMS3Bbin04_00068 [bacterium BMS3Bbin04]